MKLYRLLVKHGIVVPNYPTDEIRLVRELEEKIPKSTALRQWWFDYKSPVTDIAMFLKRARLFRSFLAKTRPEPALEIRELSLEDDEEAQGPT